MSGMTGWAISVGRLPLNVWALAFLTAAPTYPSEEAVAFWLYQPANRATLTAAARDNGLLWGDEWAGWEIDPPNSEWATGAVFVLRCRFAGDPLPYPHDPKGPRVVD